jgi:hypothetical protein
MERNRRTGVRIDDDIHDNRRFHVKCRDAAGNISSDATASFSVAAAGTPPPPSGGGALTRTVRGSGEDNDNNVSTASFTPSSNALLVAVVGGVSNGSTANPNGGSSVSGGSLSWTKRASAERESSYGGWTAWVEIWTAPVPSGSAMTVTGSNSNSMDGIFISVVEYTGHDSGSPSGVSVDDFALRHSGE